MSRSAEVMHEKAEKYGANNWGGGQHQQQQEVDEDEDDPTVVGHKGPPLEMWGNAKTMNMNNIVISNVLQSPYFKNVLIKMKTFHEVIDEIYYKVDHLEPWERGTRKTSGQVGMCGGVRGVGAGGIVSSAYCLLFKLFTLKLTEKQLLVLLNHGDSPYIRGLGFMFVRYCVDPKLYWYWFELYLEDQEEIDPKAGGGGSTTMGQMVRAMILRLDWYGTLFPRIPVPVHKEIEKKLVDMNLNDERKRTANEMSREEAAVKEREAAAAKEREQVPKIPEKSKVEEFGEAEKIAQRRREEEKKQTKHRSSSRDRKDKEKERERDKDRHRTSSSTTSDRHKKESRKSRDRSPDRSRDKKEEKKRSHQERSRDRGSSRDRKRDKKKRDKSPTSRSSRDHHRSPPRRKSRSPKRKSSRSPVSKSRRSRSKDRSPVRKRSRSRDRR